VAADDDGFLASLDHLVADAVAEEAARERAQERTLRTIAEAAATFVGVALDLAERGTSVIARTAAGRPHRGRILGIGRDFLVLRDARRPPAFLALGAVSSLRTEPGADDGEAAGGRASPIDVSFAALLAQLSGDRPRVQVVATGDAPVAGELRSVGLDVLTIRLDGDRRLVTHVRIGAVSELLLFDA
jgi:hypothetical protein